MHAQQHMANAEHIIWRNTPRENERKRAPSDGSTLRSSAAYDRANAKSIALVQ